MKEARIKHLELIQDIITRMSGNLFLLKGWSITLIVGLIAIIGKDLNIKSLIFSFVILFIFWILDGYFLSLERCYRGLYDDVRKRPDEEDADFSMDIRPFRNGRNTWIRSIASTTLVIFYGTLFVAMLGTTFLSDVNRIRLSIEIGHGEIQKESIGK